MHDLLTYRPIDSDRRLPSTVAWLIHAYSSAILNAVQTSDMAVYRTNFDTFIFIAHRHIIVMRTPLLSVLYLSVNTTFTRKRCPIAMKTGTFLGTMV